MKLNHIWAVSSGFHMGPLENDVTAKMVKERKGKKRKKGDKPFYRKANFKIHFGACMMLHITNLIAANDWRDKQAKYLIFNVLKLNKISWSGTCISFLWGSVFSSSGWDKVNWIFCDRPKIRLKYTYIQAYYIWLCCSITVLLYLCN